MKRDMMVSRGSLIVALVAIYIHSSVAARILMLPVQAGSHLIYFSAIAEGLKKYDHQIWIVLGATYPVPGFVKVAGINVVTFKTTDNWYSDNQRAIKDYCAYIIDHPDDPFGGINEDTIKGMHDAAEMYALDEQLMKTLKEINFDLAVVDGLFFHRHAYLMVEELGLPYVSIAGRFDPWIQRIPALPSFVPYMETHLTEKMSFFERLRNMFQMILWANMKISEISLSPKIRTRYAEILQRHHVDELAKRSLLWLIVSDPILDYPRPLLPHVITIGGITVRPAKPLPKDLQKFFDDAKDGVIVVSFGSAVVLPQRIIVQMLEAFRNVPQRVLWKLDNEQDIQLPANVKVLSWLPQRDALAHANTKVFITHCGNNGQYEAVYSGVPMIGMPIWGDQHYNRNRMVYRGIGIGLVTSNVTAETLVNAIHSIIEDPSYSSKAKRMGEISRHYSPNTKERAAFWVDHVIKYGGWHLRSYGIDMPWYQYIMLDIICFIITVVMIFLYVTFKLIRALIRYSMSKVKKVKLQ